MKHYFIWATIFIIFLGSSCSTDNNLYRKSNQVNNEIALTPPLPWIIINAEGSDYALSNQRTKSLFLFNSSCKKFESNSLQTLTNSILNGIDNLVITSKNKSFYHMREAIDVVALGKVDGIQRFFKITTIAKNNCIYDYVLISTSVSNLEADSIFFMQFLQRIILN